jgi:YbbR domain-containing protein
MERRLRKIVFQNLGLKVFSLILALFLWYTVAGQEKVEVNYIVPVVKAGVPDTIFIDESDIEFVQVRLRGSRAAILDTSPQEIPVSLDLQDIKPGGQFIKIDSGSIRLPSGVELVDVNPKQLHIKASAKLLVPIKLNLKGSPPAGYEEKGVKVIPSKIYIIGPEKEVKAINRVDSYPIDIRGYKETLRTRVELVPPRGDIRLLQLQPTEVEVVISEKTLEKTFKDIPVEAPEGIRATFNPGKVTVTVSGPFSLIGELEASGIRALVDIGETENRIISREVRIETPEGIIRQAVKPEMVEVTIGGP